MKVFQVQENRGWFERLRSKPADIPSFETTRQKPGNFELIPVRPNWHDSAELIGYVSRINKEKYVTTQFLKFLAKAWQYDDIPFFLCLDEMNLAPIEQYFAEYLSLVETLTLHDGKLKSDPLFSRSDFENPSLYDQILSDLNLSNDPRFSNEISLPPNLIVVGTVNMDETTHSFSRKVLDRAMTIEMNEFELASGLTSSSVAGWSYPEIYIYIAQDQILGNFCLGSEVYGSYPESEQVIDHLAMINEVLTGSAFRIAYRVRDEFLIYCYYSSLVHDKPLNWLSRALDEMTSMKVLSRIEGDEGRTETILKNLRLKLSDDFEISNAKLDEMSARLKSGYTSFWA